MGNKGLRWPHSPPPLEGNSPRLETMIISVLHCNEVGETVLFGSIFGTAVYNDYHPLDEDTSARVGHYVLVGSDTIE